MMSDINNNTEHYDVRH